MLHCYPTHTNHLPLSEPSWHIPRLSHSSSLSPLRSPRTNKSRITHRGWTNFFNASESKSTAWSRATGLLFSETRMIASPCLKRREWHTCRHMQHLTFWEMHHREVWEDTTRFYDFTNMADLSKVNPGDCAPTIDGMGKEHDGLIWIPGVEETKFETVRQDTKDMISGDDGMGWLMMIGFISLDMTAMKSELLIWDET